MVLGRCLRQHGMKSVASTVINLNRVTLSLCIYIHLSVMSSFTPSLCTASSQSEGDKGTVRPPRNLSRLGRTYSNTSSTSSTSTTTSTLGPPIDIQFKVPSLPRHQPSIYQSRQSGPTSVTTASRKPLMMIDEPNAQPTSPTETGEGLSTPGRMKRLSLVARPATSVDSFHDPQGYTHTPSVRSPYSPLQPGHTEDGQSSTHTRVQSHSHRTISNLANTPRGSRMRGSISYSPASAASPHRANPLSPRPTHDGMGASRSSWDMERIYSGGAGSEEHPKGETWSDRYILHLTSSYLVESS